MALKPRGGEQAENADTDLGFHFAYSVVEVTADETHPENGVEGGAPWTPASGVGRGQGVLGRDASPIGTAR